MNNPVRNKFFIPFVLVMLLVLFRSSLLISTFNKCWAEEGARGIAAKHILEGNLTQSIFDYFQPYQGGSVIVSLMAVPFFYLFEVSTISLRLVPLFFSAAILILLYLFVDRFFNRKIAVLTSLLYIYSPPLYLQYSFYCIGNHHSAALFNVLMLFIFSKIFFVGEDVYATRKYRYFMFFGFISGLAFYYCFSSLIYVLGVLLFWYLFDKLFFIRKQFFSFLAFFIAGVFPLTYYIVSHWGLILKDAWYNPLMYLRVSSFSIDALNANELFYRIINMFKHNLVTMFNFDFFGYYPKRQAWNYFYYIVLCISYAHLIWSRRSSFGKLVRGILPSNRFNVDFKKVDPAVTLVVFPLIFILAALFTGYTNKNLFNSRYFFSLYPLFFISISIFIIDWFSGNMLKRIASIILGSSLFLIVVISSLSLLGRNDPYVAKIYELIPFLRSRQIKYLYTYYIHKWPIVFESNEEIIPSGEDIWSCNTEKTRIFNDNKVGERYFEYEKMVDRAVDEGRRYAYSFLDSDAFGHYLMLEDYLAAKHIEYKKDFIKPNFLVYYNFSKPVKPKDVNFKQRWKEKNPPK